MPQDLIYKIISLMDLTSLNVSDTEETILNLCNKLPSLPVLPASICIYPKFVAFARKTLDKLGLENFPLTTVGNFPGGDTSLETVLTEINLAAQASATEIDIVAPYSDFLEGKEQFAADFLLHSVNEAHKLGLKIKIILETGELQTSENIARLAELVLQSGADFLKTSTGKVKINATIESSKVILNTISASHQLRGFKAAGGIKTVTEAVKYLKLGETIFGKQYLTPLTFRLGASSLLTDALNLL